MTMMIRGRSRRVSEVGLWLEAQLEESRRKRDEERIRMAVIADLLRGDCTVLGKPVKLVFPAGLWGTMTEADVLKLVERAAGRDSS